MKSAPGAKAARREARPASRSVPMVRARALVVDADDELRAFAAEALNSFRPGLEVATARSLEEAINWLDTFDPDLLLLSDNVAEGEPWALAETIHQKERTRHCNVILLAEHPPSEYRLDPARVRVHAVLSRPVNLKTLLGTARRLLQR